MIERSADPVLDDGTTGAPRRIPLGPAEGWMTVALVALMAVVLAWAIDEPRWVLGVDSHTDFLPWVALGGVTMGLIGAKAGWSRWLAHTVGAVMAALLLPLIVGAILLDGWAVPGELYRATAVSVTEAWIDLAILQRTITTEFGHYSLALGILVWGSGQFAAYAVFGHRRPLDAVIVLGLVLLVNMSMTYLDQLRFLILFSLAGLLLLARSHAFEEQTAWIRRRIGDPAAVRSLYLRGGTVFLVAAVTGSLVLTATAASAPLAGIWPGVPATLYDVADRMQRFLPDGGDRIALPAQFGGSSRVAGLWLPSDALAMRIQLPVDESRRFLWRAVSYDQLEKNGYRWSDESSQMSVQAGATLFEGFAEEPGAEGRREVSFVIRPEGGRRTLVISPEAAARVSHEARITVIGGNGYFGGVALARGADQYEVTALIPLLGDDHPLGRTQNRLRAAGVDYPDEIMERYLQVPEGAILQDSRRFLDEVLARAADNPYDIARTMEQMLLSPRFSYSTDVRGLPCGDLSTVECFTRFRQGFCQYYASTMAILLREVGIPTRIAEGYLPGATDAFDVQWIYENQAHAWVEVYFPGFGWVEFDPTGGLPDRGEPLPSGAPVATPDPVASPSFGFVTPRPGEEDEDPTARPGGISGNSPRPPDERLPFVVIALLLAIIGGALAFAAWQRGPRGPVNPDTVWRSISRVGARFGFAPRPNQTVYEYADALGEVLPSSRPELQTVAHAKVEVAYGRRQLGEDRLAALGEAQRRLRLSMLRLLFRRGGPARRR